MYLRENPVLQRELLVNLRMNRAFVLLFFYILALGLVVYAAWPNQRQLDMTNPEAAKKLVDLFFLGQFLITSLMAPSFAAGAITGEKERMTYEMLLASPLKPAAILIGKLLASLCHLGILIICSLPIVMLCVPLGGVSFFEVVAIYVALACSVVTFGAISIACSSFFRRTMAALTVSYLIILPMALLGAALWHGLAAHGFFRVVAIVTLLPAGAALITTFLFLIAARRLMHPPDVGSEGKDVVDLDQEMKKAVGMVIQSDQFPDKLFAPAKRNTLMPDGTNPVYDKEMRSELFSQGTLMLRIVIQVSMFLAIPLMAFFFYIWPSLAPWYVCYVVLFNMLIGPVFSADRITSERERQTLELMLTTIISPWKILWGKLISGLRISTVLTAFLIWPVLLACLMVSYYWSNWTTMVAYLVIVALTCVTTATIALFCSVLFRKTVTSLMTAYLVIVVLFTMPPAVSYFTSQFVTSERAINGRAERMQDIARSVAEREGKTSPTPADVAGYRREAIARAENIRIWVHLSTFTSPFSTAHSLPLKVETGDAINGQAATSLAGDWALFILHAVYTLLLNLVLFGAIMWLFNMRWRVTY